MGELATLYKPINGTVSTYVCASTITALMVFFSSYDVGVVPSPCLGREPKAVLGFGCGRASLKATSSRSHIPPGRLA